MLRLLNFRCSFCSNPLDETQREALLARGVHGNKANVATARELACWVWAVGLMAEEA